MRVDIADKSIFIACAFLMNASEYPVSNRRRSFTFPKMGEKAYFVAIPTSSGTGSEVTPFAVITDQETGVKYPLADYQLLPNMSIVDTDNMMSQPKGLTSASGVDVLTHALEAYASVMATDYTDGLALKAMKNVFEYLPTAYNDGGNVEARSKMADASCMAGMAFANAFLGVCHSMAHKLGAFHHLPHGIALSTSIRIPWPVMQSVHVSLAFRQRRMKRQ